MHIITLTEIQFKNYSQLHSKRNYKQTINYANVMKEYNYQPLYLGFIDNFDNVVCACLILYKKINNKYKIGYVKDGYLIDFTNYELLNNFTNSLKEYLNNLNFIYIEVTPNFAYKIFDSKNIVIKCYPNILDNMKKSGYISTGFNNEFNKYVAILNTTNNVDNTYNKLSRNIKRKIKDSKLSGITYFKNDDLNKFYELINKKKKTSIDYYNNLNKNYKNDFEIYFAKINPLTYINNYRKLLANEKRNNERFQELLINNSSKNNKILDRKMKSDKLINKYQNEVINASNLLSKYPDGLIISTIAIIKTDNTIYFIEEGYNDKEKDIHSIEGLKWEIIKTYITKGYKIFNLGNLPSIRKDNKYYGLYLSKVGFNPRIYEYSGNFDLIINKYLYKITKVFNKDKFY